MKTYQELIQETGLYTYRKLNTHSVEYLRDWMDAQKIPNPIRPGDLHCTIVASESSCEGYTVDPTLVMLDPKTFYIRLLNEALVIGFRSQHLEDQWQRAMNLGARCKWTSFVPHISLSYKVPIDFDYTNVKPPTAYLVLDSEKARPYTSEFQSFEDDDASESIYVPTHSLNVPRAEMPQIANGNMMEFVDWIEEQGHIVQYIDIPVAILKSAQQGTDVTKVAVLTNGASAALKKPLLISKDNYIIDGHHRWLAMLNKDPQSIVEAYRVNLTFDSLLSITHNFDKTFYK